MREQAIDQEKWYQMTHGLKIREGEEFTKEEYGTKGEESSYFSDMRCQKVERYGILKTTDKHKQKNV